MLYWMNDLTGEVKALEDGHHPGEKWFEISPADYEASRRSAQQGVQRIGGTCLHKNIDPDSCVCLDCGENRPVPANR